MFPTQNKWIGLHFSSPRLRQLDRLGWYWMMTLILVAGIGVMAMDVFDVGIRGGQWNIVLSGPFPYVHGSYTPSPAHAIAGFINIDKVAPELRSKLPAGVETDSALPVTVGTIPGDLKTKILLRLMTVPLDLLVVCILWLLRKIVLSAVDGANSNPFVRANVRRLRVIAVVLLAMPLVAEWSQFAAFELLDRTVIKGISVNSWDATAIPVELGVGILLLILAEVFAAGIRLREDVEGLV